MQKVVKNQTMGKTRLITICCLLGSVVSWSTTTAGLAAPGYLNGRYWDECTYGDNPRLGRFALCAANTQEYRLQYTSGVSVQGRCGYPKFYINKVQLREAQRFHAQICGNSQPGLTAAQIMAIEASKQIGEALTRQYKY
jgi:hypothetical protein